MELCGWVPHTVSKKTGWWFPGSGVLDAISANLTIVSGNCSIDCTIVVPDTPENVSFFDTLEGKMLSMTLTEEDDTK